MPTFKIGNMWTIYEQTDLFLITTNSTLDKSNALIMGAGIAKQAKQRFPRIEEVMGHAVHATCGNLGEYGLLISPRWPTAKLGAFQSKTQWQLPARLSVIQKSTSMLLEWVAQHPDSKVALNFPGIGYGRLSKASIRPILDQLPNNVEIWTY